MHCRWIGIDNSTALPTPYTGNTSSHSTLIAHIYARKYAHKVPRSASQAVVPSRIQSWPFMRLAERRTALRAWCKSMSVWSGKTCPPCWNFRDGCKGLRPYEYAAMHGNKCTPPWNGLWRKNSFFLRAQRYHRGIIHSGRPQLKNVLSNEK